MTRSRSDHLTDPRPLAPITGLKPQFPSIHEANLRARERAHRRVARAGLFMMVASAPAIFYSGGVATVLCLGGTALFVATCFVSAVFSGKYRSGRVQ